MFCFFFFFGLVKSFDLCGMCVRYGKTALNMARSNAPKEVIVQKAEKKCKEFGGMIEMVCKKYLDSQIDALIEEARSNTKTAEEYCVEKMICSPSEIKNL